MRAMVHSPTSILLHAALSKAVPFEQYLAHFAQATACSDSQINRGVERKTSFDCIFVDQEVRQSRHARVKMPPHYYSTLARSIFAEWGLNQGEYSSRGVPSKPWPSFARSR